MGISQKKWLLSCTHNNILNNFINSTTLFALSHLFELQVSISISIKYITRAFCYSVFLPSIRIHPELIYVFLNPSDQVNLSILPAEAVINMFYNISNDCNYILHSQQNIS